jgi:hypothetical protein
MPIPDGLLYFTLWPAPDFITFKTTTINFQTMNKQRKFIFIASVIGLLSIFLPWASINMMGMGQSVNGFRSYGIVVFIGFAAAAIISIVGDQTKTLDKTLWIASLIAGVISVLFTVIFMGNLGSAFGAGGGFGLVKIGFGFGLWLGLIASIAVLASAWLFRNPEDNLKAAFDSLKKDVSAATTSISKPAAGTAAAADSVNKIAELEKLSKLRENGSITEEEFQQLKSKLL